MCTACNITNLCWCSLTTHFQLGRTLSICTHLTKFSRRHITIIVLSCLVNAKKPSAARCITQRRADTAGSAGFLNCVAAGSKPAHKLRNTGPQFCYRLLDSSRTRGLGSIPWSDHAFHLHVGGAWGGGSVHCTLPYALTYKPMLHTFVGTQHCQLYQHDVVLIQLATLGS